MPEASTSLQLSEVLAGVYQKLKAEANVVREFQDANIEWASYSDWGRTKEVDYYFNGFVGQTSPQSGILVAAGELSGKEWLLSFEKALFLAQISLKEKPEFQVRKDPNKPSPDEILWRFDYASNWDELTVDNLGRIIRRFKHNEDRNKPALFIWKNRLIFESVEVTEHLASPAKYSEKVSQGTGAFNGILFVSDYPGESYQSPMGGMVAAIEEGARYFPQVVDFLTSRLQQKTGLNQP